MTDPHVRISAGATVIYQDDTGDHRAALVRAVDPDRDLVEAAGVPGVLRIRDIVAVGVYGDEAQFHLDADGTGGDRITMGDQVDD